MKNVLKQLAERFLIPLGLTVAESVADAGINKKILGLSIRPLDLAQVTAWMTS